MSSDDHADGVPFTAALVHDACSVDETAAGWRRLANPVHMNDRLGQWLPVGYQTSAFASISTSMLRDPG